MTSAIDTDQKTHLYGLISKTDLDQNQEPFTQVVCSVTKPPTMKCKSQRLAYIQHFSLREPTYQLDLLPGQ